MQGIHGIHVMCLLSGSVSLSFPLSPSPSLNGSSRSFHFPPHFIKFKRYFSVPPFSFSGAFLRTPTSTHSSIYTLYFKTHSIIQHLTILPPVSAFTDPFPVAMHNNHNDRFASIETTCGLLLLELQKLWDEVGDNDVQRDKVLFEIEEECLEVYRRKVDEAGKCRSELLREIASVEAEIEDICSVLSEQPVKDEQKAGESLREKLQIIVPQLEEMRKRKAEREKQFAEVLDELKNISIEIFGSATEINMCGKLVDSDNLSMRRLEQLRNQLCELQNEKSNRLKQVECHLDTLSSLCEVLGMDFKNTIHEIHPTLDDSKRAKDVTSYTIERLTTVIQSVRDVKIQRMQRLQGLGTVLLELWDLMGTPIEEQQMFQNVTSVIAASEHQITECNMLSMDFINQVEDEVSRLKQLKSTKLKEIILKKRLELEEICRNSHIVTELLTAATYSIEAEPSGVDPVHLLEEIEFEIAKVKEEAFSRKEILDKVEKWFGACDGLRSITGMKLVIMPDEVHILL
ncbi:hypothetical protein MANES_05G044843v8 [Manihot esculenta]|uniref:Uncharacterized protein n=1 Tax=Manihot esculenta TaxID=3983 RepID=A0ACB7HPP8_MANES|nr:hypothetical protein MANES_05G044843v8 [Manihot esculenta]